MMNIELFITTLIVTMAVVAIAMLYLRHTTRKVIIELCQSESGADFWLRSADILGYSGALVLVLVFGGGSPDWVETLRMTLILSLSGVFLTVIFVATNVWRTVAPQMKANAIGGMK